MLKRDEGTKKEKLEVATEHSGDEAYDGVIRLAFEISQRRAAQLQRIKESLMAGDQNMALEQMRSFLGVV